nr:MFS transporter [Chloroflexota bacterium]
MLEVLRLRNFVLLWFGGLVSLIGDRAMRIALPVYVYQQTGSTLATAGMAATYYLPAVVLGSVAGVFADRWDRRQIMVAANLIQATVMLLLLLVRSDGWLWLVYVVSLVDTSVATFFQPAES